MNCFQLSPVVQSKENFGGTLEFLKALVLAGVRPLDSAEGQLEGSSVSGRRFAIIFMASRTNKWWLQENYKQADNGKDFIWLHWKNV